MSDTPITDSFFAQEPLLNRGRWKMSKKQLAEFERLCQTFRVNMEMLERKISSARPEALRIPERVHDLLTRIQSVATPIDDAGGDDDARVPAALYRELVDLHADSIYERAQPLAWIATHERGTVAHFSTADGWRVEAVQTTPSPRGRSTGLAGSCPHCGVAPGALCGHVEQPCLLTGKETPNETQAAPRRDQ